MDYRKILGISASAGSDEIKSAYRKLAKRYHPDLNGPEASVDMFNMITKAYHALIGSQKNLSKTDKRYSTEEMMRYMFREREKKRKERIFKFGGLFKQQKHRVINLHHHADAPFPYENYEVQICYPSYGIAGAPPKSFRFLESLSHLAIGLNGSYDEGYNIRAIVNPLTGDAIQHILDPRIRPDKCEYDIEHQRRVAKAAGYESFIEKFKHAGKEYGFQSMLSHNFRDWAEALRYPAEGGRPWDFLDTFALEQKAMLKLALTKDYFSGKDIFAMSRIVHDRAQKIKISNNFTTGKGGPKIIRLSSDIMTRKYRLFRNA